MGGAPLLNLMRVTRNPDPFASYPFLIRLEPTGWGGPSDGGTVQTWSDPVRSVSATQATSAARPLYRASAAGYPCLEFASGGGSGEDPGYRRMSIPSITAVPTEYIVRMRFPTSTGSNNFAAPLGVALSEVAVNGGYFVNDVPTNYSRFNSYASAWRNGENLNTRYYDGDPGLPGDCRPLNEWFVLRVRPAHSRATIAALIVNDLYGATFQMSHAWVFSRGLTAPEAAAAEAYLMGL